MKIIFLEKSYIKCGGETIHRPYSKKWKLSISLEKYSNVLCSFFIVCPSQGLSKYVKIKLQTTCFYFISSFLKKTKRGLELFPLPHFLQDFWRRIFLKLYSINWPDLIVWLSFFHEILGNICIVIACFQGCNVINCLFSRLWRRKSWNWSYLSYQPCFLYHQKRQDKIFFKERKMFLRWN